MTFEEFYTVTLNKRGAKGPSKISNSYGIIDYYKYYREHSKHKVNDKLYRKILQAIDKECETFFLEDRVLHFPCGLGNVQIQKIPFKRNVKKPQAVDWKETLKLWYEDEDAHKKKIKILKEIKDIILFTYSKGKRFYSATRFVCLDVSRGFKKKVQKLQEENNFECYG